MADKAQPKTPPKIEFDALADELLPDPSKPLDAVALIGFLGRSAQAGNVRLYDDVRFQGYYEISASDILHTRQFPTTLAPLGGSVVYVKGGARLQHVQVSKGIEAQFLQGPMSTAATSAERIPPSLVRQSRALITIQHCRTDAPTSCADVCPGHRTVECWGAGFTFDCA
jgi:hypothetical protein